MFLNKCKMSNQDGFLALCNIIAQTFNPNESLINDVSEL